MGNSVLSTISAGGTSDSLARLPVQPLHQQSCQFSTLRGNRAVSKLLLRFWDMHHFLLSLVYQPCFRNNFLSWLLGFSLSFDFFLHVMNDGSNREAADNIQNSLLALQMAEAEQEFAVMCYASVGVMEPEQKSKFSPTMGSFVSGWAQP